MLNTSYIGVASSSALVHPFQSISAYSVMRLSSTSFAPFSARVMSVAYATALFGNMLFIF